MAGKKIIVSNRLPVTVKESQEGDIEFSPSAGGLATGLSSIYKEEGNLWIGWPGMIDVDKKQEKTITKALHKDNMFPVFLSKQEIKKYYEGYSNGTLWPLFHYFTEFAKFDDEEWQMYVMVNQRFCDAILQNASDDDVIWVHDYQLLLLPGMLRERLPNATIGFFQHIPFPSYEIFRLLPHRVQILQGMIGADLLGFHTYDDMRHFMSSVSRILGYGHSMGNISVGNRLIAVDAFPMGIDYEKFEQSARSRKTHTVLQRYKSLWQDQKLILSIDRLDYTKGIKRRLLALDRFLDAYPDYKGKVSMILLVVPSRDKVGQYQQLKEEIDTLVGNINGKHSRLNWMPIHYFYRSLSFPVLSALYTRSDVALITPNRDGMNLVCKEYVASKVDRKGVLILSEMAGAAKELSEAILINPNDEGQIVEAIKSALEMPLEEQSTRLLDMQQKLKRYNVHKWVDRFMEGLTVIKNRQKELDARNISVSFKKELKKRYDRAENRIMFLDYDGTLKGFDNDPKSVFPDQELINLLTKLTNDPKNTIVVISGRDKYTLNEWLKGLKVDIVAEHGVWTRKYGEAFSTIEPLGEEWKEKIGGIIERYVDRTPGALSEYKDYSIAWHYRKADPEFGIMRSRELVDNLRYMTSDMNLQIMQGNKVIEVKHQEVNKGRAASKWLSDEQDFILTIGDDVTDEDMFKVMPKRAHTIKVGMGTTAASYHVKSHKDVRALLGYLCEL
ncbi:bifunctional alpha,alpha-trehalose-phosphate synthase (UDP-forming)/trehalose-phosphatase [Algivirga pacifica]|uniref:Alpha,alpha-trehalose-phosphate synthase n=1 Tax=Algivirga pacifica TaxID=1162670 RepID=A0ABP9DTJ4_9BACT